MRVNILVSRYFVDHLVTVIEHSTGFEKHSLTFLILCKTLFCFGLKIPWNIAARAGQILWPPRKYDNSEVSWNQNAGIIKGIPVTNLFKNLILHQVKSWFNKLELLIFFYWEATYFSVFFTFPSYPLKKACHEHILMKSDNVMIIKHISSPRNISCVHLCIY